MSNELILVVDDNLQLADFVANTILPSLGYRTIIAHDGEQALEAVHQSPPDLMLLDLELPDINGLEVLRRLSSENRNFPTILFTAHGSEQVAVDAFRLGVQDYLIKPVDAESLDHAISQALMETRLRKETERLTAQLQERVSWLNALTKVGQSVTSTLDLDEVLRRIVEAGVYLTKAEEGFLALLDEESGQLYLRAAKNIDEEESKTLLLPINDSLIGRVLRSGKPIRISSQTEGSLIKVSTGFLVHSLLHVPILSRGDPLGVFSVDNRKNPQSFSPEDEVRLISLADYAAVAIENAALYQNAQHEIAERKRAEQALRESEERYARAVQGANDGIWDWDLKSNQIYFSTRWKAMLGYSENEVGDEPSEWFSRIHPEDIEKVKLNLSAHIRGVTSHFENEHRMRHKDGSYRWMLSRGLAVRDVDRTASRIAGSQTDITDRKNAEAKLLHDAFYDRLTGLPNRALLMDRLKSAIERTKRRKDYLFAMFFLDLDQFKNVNDTLGHPVGDQLLIAVANMLRNNLRSTDTVARLGGDEFVILLEDLKDTVTVTSIAEWIHQKFTSPIILDQHEVFVTTSIGVVLSTIGYNQPEDMLRDADIAMYAAKARGKANYEIFNPSMRERIMKRMAIEADLRQAVQNRQILIYYQPIVSLTTGQLVGLEALARWQHPERGLLTPQEFIPIAQETGTIIVIDQWMLEQACHQMNAWLKRYAIQPPLKLNINLTDKLFMRPNLPEEIQQTLSKTGMNEQHLVIEITEHAFKENSTVVMSTITELRKSGIQVFIDNFGKGSSPIMRLREFPVDALKIDPLFIESMNEHGENVEILRTIIGLAHDLGMQACAEGVETESQLASLKSIGCDNGQGYLFSIPITPQAVETLLDSIAAQGNSLALWGDIAAR